MYCYFMLSFISFMSMHLFGSDAQHNGAVDLPTISQYMAQRPKVEAWLTRLSDFAQDEALPFEQKIEKEKLSNFCEEFEQFAQEERSVLHMLTVHRPLAYKFNSDDPSWKLMIAILCHTQQDLNKTFESCLQVNDSLGRLEALGFNDRLCLFSSPLQSALSSYKSKELVELCLLNRADANQPLCMMGGDALGLAKQYFDNPKKQAQVVRLLLAHGFKLQDYHASWDKQMSWIQEREALDDVHAEATVQLQNALIRRDLAQVKEALGKGAKPNLAFHPVYGDAMEMADSFKPKDRPEVKALLQNALQKN